MLWFFTFFMTLNAESLNYVETGNIEKPSVLFVHGTPGNAQAFEAYYGEPELQAEYHMVSVDRIGFGKSSKKPETSLVTHAQSVLDLLNSKWPNKVFTCVGHSYGVPVCNYLMVMAAKQFNGGVLIAGVSNPNRKILRWYNHWADTWFVKLFLSRGFENSNKEMKALKVELYKLEPLLEKIDKKILIIHGQKDKIVPFADSHHLKTKMTNAELKVLSPESMGHLLIWSEKDYLKNEIKVFLENINQASN